MARSQGVSIYRVKTQRLIPAQSGLHHLTPAPLSTPFLPAHLPAPPNVLDYSGQFYVSECLLSACTLGTNCFLYLGSFYSLEASFLCLPPTPVVGSEAAPKSIAWTAERDLLETRGVHEVGVRVVFPEPFPVQGCCLLISDLCGPKAGLFADPFFT